MLKGKQLDWEARCALGHPPELTEEIASSQWRALNVLLHSLITLQADLRDRKPLELVLRTVSSLVAAERGLLYVQARADGAFQMKGSFGFEAGVPKRLGSDSQMAEAALRHRKPLLVNRPLEGSLEEELRLVGGKHCLAVPIFRRGVAWGAVVLARPVPFLEEEGVLAWLYVLILDEMLPGLTEPDHEVTASSAPLAGPDLLESQQFGSLCDWEMERSALVDQPFSLLRLGWGRPAGSEAHEMDRTRLKRMVRSIRRSLRNVDQVSCSEGGDLLISLPGMDTIEAREVAREIRRNLLVSRCLEAGPHSGADVRLGIVTYPVHGRTREALLGALQRVFDSGRNV